MTCHRGKVVIFDLQKQVRYTLTQKWDRSVDSLVVSPFLVLFQAFLPLIITHSSLLKETSCI